MSCSKNARNLLDVMIEYRSLLRSVPAFEALSFSEMSVFFLIARAKNKGAGPVPIGGIAHELMISQPAATQLVNRLQEKRLICRMRSAEDKRVVGVSFTEEGQALFNKEMERSAQLLDSILTQMNKAETETFISLMQKFHKAAKTKLNAE